MHLSDLVDQEWKSYERRRFLSDDTKTKTDDFDPESFKHDGFDDREKYLETFVPALADDERLDQELNNFKPPRVDEINHSPYQALVIRYGILRILIQQPDYSLDKETLTEETQSWQQSLIEDYSEEDFSDNDDLLHLAQAAIEHENQIDDSELNMIHSYSELHNDSQERKHNFYTWLDFFKRLSALDRFPKVSRSEKPEHALKTIEKGLWSLQEQAIVYEISTEETNELVGIPEDYVDYIRDWLHYEMSEDNYLSMLESLDPFDDQSRLIDARETFGVDTKTQGYNSKRRESLVKAGVFPSELLREVLRKEDLKDIVDQYGLDAHKQKTDQMVQKTIEYFEQSQKYSSSDDGGADLYLQCYDEIADGNIKQVPPQVQNIVNEDDPSDKLDILFEKATAEIFRDIFNIEGTTLLGQGANGIVADGEIEQDGRWALWDNKRRKGKFKLGSSTQSKIKNYIDTKDEQHDVEWFLIIAPDFTDNAVDNANLLEMQIGKDIRLIRAEDFKQLATFWQEEFDDGDRELPLSTFYGSDIFDLETSKAGLERQFS